MPSEKMHCILCSFTCSRGQQKLNIYRFSCFRHLTTFCLGLSVALFLCEEEIRASRAFLEFRNKCPQIPISLSAQKRIQKRLMQPLKILTPHPHQKVPKRPNMPIIYEKYSRQIKHSLNSAKE